MLLRSPIVALIVTLALSILLAPLAAEAQRTGTVHRIGFLGASRASPHFLEAFRQGLRELGYAEGKNIVIEYRWAEGRYERLPGLAAELVRLKVDVIVAPTTTPALAAKNATRTIPIVFLIIADPVAQGLVTALARPGGNATGLSSTADPKIYGKQVELLREALPGVTRVAVSGIRPVHSAALC